MSKFTMENTEGYTQQQLDALNHEWDAIVARDGLELDSDEYWQASQAFDDEVARR